MKTMTAKILIIEDEVDFADLAGALLDFHGWQVESQSNPMKVEKMIDDNHYDVIVTDLMMPGKNGFEMVEMIRSKEIYKKTPVLVLSAKIISDAERKFLMMHHVDFMAKPFDPLGLIEKLRQMLADTGKT